MADPHAYDYQAWQNAGHAFAGLLFVLVIGLGIYAIVIGLLGMGVRRKGKRERWIEIKTSRRHHR